MIEVTPEMEQAVEALDDELRTTGIYLEHSHFVEQDGVRWLICDALLGDVAFSERVQNPGKASTDRAVRQMDIDLGRSEFGDAREKLRRRIVEGRPLMGGDE